MKKQANLLSNPVWNLFFSFLLSYSCVETPKIINFQQKKIKPFYTYFEHVLPHTILDKILQINLRNQVKQVFLYHPLWLIFGYFLAQMSKCVLWVAGWVFVIKSKQFRDFLKKIEFPKILSFKLLVRQLVHLLSDDNNLSSVLLVLKRNVKKVYKCFVQDCISSII